MAQPLAGEPLVGAIMTAPADGDQAGRCQGLHGVVHGGHRVVAVTGNASGGSLGIAESHDLAVGGLAIGGQLLCVTAAAVFIDRLGTEP